MTTHGRGSTLLLFAAFMSFAIAVLHFGMVFVGAPAYRWFGGGERFAHLAETGSWFPAEVTIVAGLVFAIGGWFALSGAGVGPRLPLRRTALIAIGAVYLLRGLSVIGGIRALLAGHGLLRYLVFSIVALVTGLAYVLGAWAAWRRIAAR